MCIIIPHLVNVNKKITILRNFVTTALIIVSSFGEFEGSKKMKTLRNIFAVFIGIIVFFVTLLSFYYAVLFLFNHSAIFRFLLHILSVILFQTNDLHIISLNMNFFLGSFLAFKSCNFISAPDTFGSGVARIVLSVVISIYCVYSCIYLFSADISSIIYISYILLSFGIVVYNFTEGVNICREVITDVSSKVE